MEYERGRTDCYLDRCENTPFASVGGLDKRDSPLAPKYIDPQHARGYIAGYESMSEDLYGSDWKTCSFSWKLAVTINAKE